MIKKFALATVICLLPILAYAANMQVTSSAIPVSGGSITPNGLKFFPAAASYTIAVNPGWSISSVLIDNVASPSGTSTTQTVPFDTSKVHTIKVTFVQGSYSITTSAGDGGQILVTGGGSTNIASGSSRTLIVSPDTGYLISNYTVDNGAPVVPANPAVAASILFSNITDNHSVIATFAPLPVVTAFAGINQTITASGNAPWSTTLAGSATSTVGGITYQWNLLGVPAGATASFGSPTSATTQFSVNAPGTYSVTLTATSGGVSATSAPMTVTVAGNGLGDSNVCLTCHAGQAPVSLWQSSRHALAGPYCSNCHNPNLALPHPGNTLSALYQTCGACHFDSSGNVPLHPVEIGVNTCVTCHNPHSTAASWLSVAQSAHYNAITSGRYPASYVTPRANCSDCHYATLANGVNRHEWAISGHAATTSPAWTDFDFKNMTGCVQCHTTTGFIAYSSGKMGAAWGDASDRTKEVLRCNGCHSDITNGTVRTLAPVKPYADDSYTHPDDGKSNVCLVCHSGTRNGSSITARIGATAAFSNMTMIDPHSMAAGGTMYGVAGYHFPGRTYTADLTRSHRDINSVDSKNTVMGPCITCHKNAFFDHTFRPSWSSNPLCSSCHVTALSDTRLSDAKTALVNALEVLRAQLAVKGFVYSPAYPYFSSTNWGLGAAGADTMGAAFNYVLVLREPGAFAHNPSYAKHLVLDSIDFLDNGVIDDSVASIALPGLVATGAISQAAADSISSYKAKNLCTTCHGGTAATANPMSTSAHPAHLSGAYGPGAYLGASLSACQACHAYNAPQHMNGVVDVLNGAGSACANCHSGNVPAWGGTARLDCTSCHSANPAVLPNGTAAPYKANFSGTGHGRFTASNQCTICHDPDSPHISGSLGSFVRLRLSNDNAQCGSCHNGTTAPAMSSHVLDRGETPNPNLCKECHDVHGTTNLHMIKTVINGRSVAFTNTSTGFVKKVAPFDGICQVCHTLTNHFRSGQTPDSHPDRNCLACHSHRATFAFKPSGTCDSCHGYPPAATGAGGTQGNYSSARVEDYLGGSGAHTTEAHIRKTARPSEGWANCTMCHANGSMNPATHTMSLPLTPSRITIDVDDQFKFNASLSLGPGQYSGLLVDGGANATGTCSNVSCHFQPTQNWSAVK